MTTEMASKIQVREKNNDRHNGKESQMTNQDFCNLGILPLNSFSAALMVHMINNRICETIGEQQIAWDDAPEYMREGLISALEDDLSPEDIHIKCMENRLANGWVLGPVKDVEKKTSPCLVPYNELPIEQRLKDSVRVGVRDFLKAYGTAHNWETGEVHCSHCDVRYVNIVPYGAVEPFRCAKCFKNALYFKREYPIFRCVQRTIPLQDNAVEGK